MSQQFTIHRSLLNKAHKMMIKNGGKTFKKNNAGYAVNHLCQADPSLQDSLDYSIMAEEYYWKQNGHNVIFPGNQTFFEKLYGSKFTIHTQGGFSLPFNSFIVTTPKNFEIEGVPIPSFLVSSVNYQQRPKKVLYPFYDYCDLPRMPNYHEPSTAEDVALSIAYKDPYSESYVSALTFNRNLPEILNAKSTQAFRKAMGDIEDSRLNISNLNDQDVAVQMRVTKLTAALGVYHAATEGKKLVKGFPNNQAAKADRDTSFTPNVYSYNSPATTGTTQGEHVRGWTFRQLQHEKYYKGQYAHLEPGSRVVFVDSYVAGTKADPYTQN